MRVKRAIPAKLSGESNLWEEELEPWRWRWSLSLNRARREVLPSAATEEESLEFPCPMLLVSLSSSLSVFLFQCNPMVTVSERIKWRFQRSSKRVRAFQSLLVAVQPSPLCVAVMVGLTQTNIRTYQENLLPPLISFSYYPHLINKNQLLPSPHLFVGWNLYVIRI